jgi:hypothetical protein
MDVQANWQGNDVLNGSVSAVSGVYVVSVYLILLVLAGAVLILVLAAGFILFRRRRLQALPAAVPENPSTDNPPNLP